MSITEVEITRRPRWAALVARRTVLTQVATVAIPVAVWFAPLGVASRTQHSLAILSFMILAWISESIDYAVAGLLGCVLFWALGVAKFDQAFIGFVDPTTWFMFAALLMGQIASSTTVAKRLASWVMLRVGGT
jgi:di/tricarboxylate transporter